ncbi:MAG TPA: hypothetical protein VF812_09320 [Ktedonobacterales bacterium]
MMRARYALSAACLLLAITATLLGGCDLIAITSAPARPTATPAPHITALWVVLTAPFRQNRTAAFDRVVRDPAQAQRAYDALKALKPSPTNSGFISCPMDTGEMLHLTFYDGTTPIVKALVKPDGCEYAQILDSKNTRLSVDETFWTTFAQALGISPSGFQFPLGAAGPIAPVDVPTAPASGLP